jgi:glycosyltransferase involved in cell wall biosynthesis
MAEPELMARPRTPVAIVLRTRERPILLRRALADVCAQSFPGWELVVVNDGGDPAEVEKLIAEQPGLAERVTVLHNDRPRGMEAASNQALAASASDYVAIHDDDDTWHPAFLARTVAHLDATGDAAVAVRTEIVWEHVHGESVTEQGREAFMPDIRSFTLFDLLRTNRFVPISVLYRRDVHDEVGPFREDLTVVGDWEFHLRVAQSSRPTGFLDGEPLAFWHQRREADGALANSVLGQAREHRLLDLRVRDEALREHAQRHGLGALLYVTRYFQSEFDHVHGRFEVGEGLTREVLGVLAGQRELLERQGELLRRQEERLAELERARPVAGTVSLLRRGYRRLKAALTR